MKKNLGFCVLIEALQKFGALMFKGVYHIYRVVKGVWYDLVINLIISIVNIQIVLPRFAWDDNYLNFF